MSNEILNSLLKEYEQKKLQAELNLEKRKQNLYNKIPRLREIEDELNSFAINTAKNILNEPNKSLDELYNKINTLKKEKNIILLQNNITEEYLKPYYECKLCNDTGYITKNYKTTMCSCLKQKLLNVSYNKSNISNLNKENFEAFNEFIFSDDVDFAKYKFNISPRKNIINIKNKCIDFVNNFENPDFKNLLFTGNTGLR
jgi:DNA replication protein DnaC